MTEHKLSMSKALGLIPSTKKEEPKTNKYSQMMSNGRNLNAILYRTNGNGGTI